MYAMILVTGCQLPLYLRLAVDVAARWRSYDVIKPTVQASLIPDTISGLVTTLFTRLETRYGVLLVSHALGYITVAKRGLTPGELEDILSCDDEVNKQKYFCFYLLTI